MQKLHTIVALVQGRKSRWHQFVSNKHHAWGKGERSPVTGLMRTYQPREEDGDKLPSEHRKVQLVARDVLEEVVAEAIAFYDLIHCQEDSNCRARADVKIGDKVLIKDAPVGFLMFLEKQLTDMATFIGELPVLPPDRDWSWDGQKGCFVSMMEASIKTAKKQRPLVLYDATPEHPAQTQLVTEDVPVGTWTARHLSGALPADVKKGMQDRIAQAKAAVVTAREEANALSTEQKPVVEPLLAYIFPGFPPSA